MEFSGLTSKDFDFFKKKDKMSSEEYEKSRNDVKLHFRSLCYEMQKSYHKKTGGVLELDKDFQNFNKRSNCIFVERPIGEGPSRLRIRMNCDGITVETYVQLSEDITPQRMASMLMENKNVIWNYAMSSKNMVIYCEIASKNNKGELCKLAAGEINKKNFDSFAESISSKVEDCRGARLAVGYTYSKDECIKQSKGFHNTAYAATMEVMKLGTQMK
jgi:hypothetical protein